MALNSLLVLMCRQETTHSLILSKALLWRRAIVTISSSAGHESDSFKWRPDLQKLLKDCLSTAVINLFKIF